MGASSFADSRAPDPSWEVDEGSGKGCQVSPAPRLWSPSASVCIVEMACFCRGNPRSQPEESPLPRPFLVLRKRWCFPGLRKIAGHPYAEAEEKYLNKIPPTPKQGRTLLNNCCRCGLQGLMYLCRSSQGQRRKRAQDPQLAFQQLPHLL